MEFLLLFFKSVHLNYHLYYLVFITSALQKVVFLLVGSLLQLSQFLKIVVIVLIHTITGQLVSFLSSARSLKLLLMMPLLIILNLTTCFLTLNMAFDLLVQLLTSCDNRQDLHCTE